MTSPTWPRVLFLCRGSTRDGLGHVMRCRSIALRMAEWACVRIVVIGDGYVDALLCGQGLDYRVVEDANRVPTVAAAIEADVVVFDLERLDETIVTALAARARTVSVCPTFEHLAGCDAIFHRTRCLGPDWPVADVTLHCGLEFAVVRQQCLTISEAQYRQNLEADPLAVAVSMGGADADNKTLSVIDALGALEQPLLLWVLLGEGYAHSYNALVDCVKRHGRHEIILAKTSDSMWRVMRTCALAVLAGGTVTYEAVYAGLPSINLFEDRRHVFLVDELVERGVSLSAGWPMDRACRATAEHVARLDRDRAALWNMHRRCDGLIDGRAARRIAREIVALAGTAVHP